MGCGCRMTAGPANDARCVCEVEVLWGGRVQVKAQPGGGPLGPVTKVETKPSSLTCTVLCVRVRATRKTKSLTVLQVLKCPKKAGGMSLKC